MRVIEDSQHAHVLGRHACTPVRRRSGHKKTQAIVCLTRKVPDSTSGLSPHVLRFNRVQAVAAVPRVGPRSMDCIPTSATRGLLGCKSIDIPCPHLERWHYIGPNGEARRGSEAVMRSAGCCGRVTSSRCSKSSCSSFGGVWRGRRKSWPSVIGRWTSTTGRGAPSIQDRLGPRVPLRSTPLARGLAVGRQMCSIQASSPSMGRARNDRRSSAAEQFRLRFSGVPEHSIDLFVTTFAEPFLALQRHQQVNAAIGALHQAHESGRQRALVQRTRQVAQPNGLYVLAKL